MNKTLLHNFPKKLRSSKIDIAEDPDLMLGVSVETVENIVVDIYLPKSGPTVSELRSDILSALILHDKLCLDIYDVFHLLNLFGTDNCIKLLESKSFEVYDNLGPDASALIKDANTYKLVNSYIKNVDGSKIDKISWLEKDLHKLSAIPGNNINADQIKQILTLLILNTTNPKKEFIDELLFKETSYDLKNRNVTEIFNISSYDFDSISKDDLPKILRLHHINRGLIDAQRIDSDSVLIDKWAKKFIQGKIPPTMNEHAVHSSVDIFQNIVLSQKGIPDLNVLFENRIIDADDIIGFRETVDGELFRKWISGINYEPETILATLLNKKPPSLRDKIIKHVRFVYPAVIGIVQPIAGVAASYCDSYIVQKIMQGWHPSLFLDDKFKFKIDESIKLREKHNKLGQLQKIKGKVGRNDPCPCGSGKKI